MAKVHPDPHEIGFEGTSVHKYLELREKHPQATIVVSRFGPSLTDGIDYLHQSLKPFGVTLQDLGGVSRGDPDALERTALKTLRAINEGSMLKRKGETHLVARGLAPSKAVIGLVIARGLESMQIFRTAAVPPSFAFLTYHFLAPKSTEFDRANNANFLGRKARLFACITKAESGEFPSIRATAKQLGCAPSTILRHFGSEIEFREAAEHWYRLQKLDPDIWRDWNLRIDPDADDDDW